MKYPEIPAGLAPYYIYSPDATVCILCKARSASSNKMPESVNKIEPVAVGVAVFKFGDEYDEEKGEVIALGRALKMYNKASKKPSTSFVINNFSGSWR